MKQIRRCVFETNSSSTHSITMCAEDTFDRWVKGEFYFFTGWEYNIENESFISKDEAIEMITLKHPEYTDFDEASKNDFLREEGFLTYEEWSDNNDLETYENVFTTPKGERVVAFGSYGYDG